MGLGVLVSGGSSLGASVREGVFVGVFVKAMVGVILTILTTVDIGVAVIEDVQPENPNISIRKPNKLIDFRR